MTQAAQAEAEGRTNIWLFYAAGLRLFALNRWVPARKIDGRFSGE